MADLGRIRVGIGGWSYEPWRETFYPDSLPQHRELHYASRQLSAIEINSTFYRAPPGEIFARWRDETPEDFVFSVKAPRYCTHRKVLAEALETSARFLEAAAHLGDKLGPVVWQLPPTHRFDADDLDRFLQALPREAGPRSLRHVVEARHDSFLVAEFPALLRQHRAASVYTDSDKYPSFADLGGDFVYARLMNSQPDLPTGYPDDELDDWSERARRWAAGGEPAELPRIVDAPAEPRARDVFIYFINGAKENAPQAAGALLWRLEQHPH
ncbi:DUF72 domain-containing protein [Aquabacterium sp. A7-Y]|uniref:DUF72 domain-containing protein n=1 Tax=Aquabacterium sp. A7-Y TaxID=1349605 RepID=UPI00223D7A08|nr:DUF72 domain-containing protein [Aquabacterium sp. A7-Y]MCW7537115.1 DUF72 domain-containing protein [Aquabacterium sp. A7-Y]